MESLVAEKVAHGIETSRYSSGSHDCSGQGPDSLTCSAPPKQEGFRNFLMTEECAGMLGKLA